MEELIWNAHDKAVTAQTKQYLEEGDSTKVEVEELESLPGPEASEVDFRRISGKARNKVGSRDL